MSTCSTDSPSETESYSDGAQFSYDTVPYGAYGGEGVGVKDMVEGLVKGTILI